MIVTGIQILHTDGKKECLAKGPQVSSYFHLSVNTDEMPVIEVQCPSCGELLEFVFVS